MIKFLYNGEGVSIIRRPLKHKKKEGAKMAISYDKLFRLLEEKGITTYYLRKNKIMGQQTYYNLKNGKGNIGTETLEKLCNLLDCQPGDLMEYVPDNKTE